MAALLATTPPSPAGVAPERSERPESDAEPRSSETLRTGRYLVAAESLDGSIFGRTVILLLDFRDSGALGVIVNKPTSIPLADLFPDIEGLADLPDRAWMGGPVERNTLQLLVERSRDPQPGDHPVIGPLVLSRLPDALLRLASGDDASRFRAYVGYAGWAPRQLDGEVRRGDWLVVDAAPELVFDDDPDALWPRLTHEHRGVEVRAPAAAGSRTARAKAARER